MVRSSLMLFLRFLKDSFSSFNTILCPLNIDIGLAATIVGSDKIYVCYLFVLAIARSYSLTIHCYCLLQESLCIF